MSDSPGTPHVDDIIQAIERIRQVIGDMPLAAFKSDWQKQWLVERGVEIISEASRRLPGDFKARHPEIPWPRVAAVGNVLRHEYEGGSASIMWTLVRDELPHLERACRAELTRTRTRER